MTCDRLVAVGGFAAAVACVVSPAVRADEKPAVLIVGKWEGEGARVKLGKEKDAKEYVEKVTLEFGKDGTYKLVRGGIPEMKYKPTTETGTYAFVSETELELVVKTGDPPGKTRHKVSVGKDEM